MIKLFREDYCVKSVVSDNKKFLNLFNNYSEKDKAFIVTEKDLDDAWEWYDLLNKI